MAAPIDYAALAKQAGAVDSTPAPAAATKKVDYTALAKQAGAVDSTSPSPRASSPTPDIDYSHVAGAPATGLPGIPAAPNPILNAPPSLLGYSDTRKLLQDADKVRTGKKSQAPLGFIAPPDIRKYAKTNEEANSFQKVADQRLRTEQLINQATSEVGSIGPSAEDTVRSWWNNNKGWVGHGMAAGAGALNSLEAAGEAPFSAIDEAVGSSDQSGHPVNAAIRLAGGNPELADQFDAQGNHGAADWERWGKPGALLATGEVGGESLGQAKKALNSERFANSNFTKMIEPGFGHSIDAYYAANDLRELYRREAAANNMNIGGTFSGDAPTRNNPFGKDTVPETIKGIKNYMDLSDKVVDRTHQPIDEVMTRAKDDPIPKSVKDGILNNLREAQKRAADFGSGNYKAYDGIIKRVEDADTLGSLNQIKSDANNMMEGVLHGKGPSGSAAAIATEPVMAWKEAGNFIRQDMYPELQRYVAPPGSEGYFNIADAGRLEAKAMDARDGIYKNAHLSGQMNLPAVTQKYLEKVGQGSLYKTHILRRALDLFPSPAGQFNLTMRRGLGDLGEGSVPQLATSRKTQLKLPPPAIPLPTFPGRFDIPTAAPVETVTGAPQITPQQVYLGNHQVPNPNYSPVPLTSPLQQRAELGTTANTIPDSVRGIHSPFRYPDSPNPQAPDPRMEHEVTAARPRADQVGMGHNTTTAPTEKYGGVPTPPMRSLTGDPEIAKTNWQYLTGSKEPPQLITHNGAAVMSTSDPDIARESLKGMKSFQDSAEFKKLPKEEQKLHADTFEKLTKQMDDYEKWRTKHPLPPPPGREPLFEVWLNPGQAGKISKMTAAKAWAKPRIVAHGGRLVTQKALSGEKRSISAQQQGNEPSAEDIRAEEERMRQ